jgi:putative ATP-dependent endonuclease of OLD family
MRYFGELLGAPFDFAGISLIDYRNNGSAGAFVRLARALQFPWLMICDNDDQGRNSVREAKTCGLTDAEVGKHARVLPGVGTDLESFLFTNGFADELVELISEARHTLTKKVGEAGYEEEVLKILRGDKTGFSLGLISKLRQKRAGKNRVPAFIGSAIEDLLSMVK